MARSVERSGDWAAAAARTTIRLGYWTMGWVVTMAISTFGPIFLWDFEKVPSLIAILVNVTIGVGLIEAHRRYLLVVDELQRKIQLEAMGITLGVGVVLGLAYSNLDVTDLIASDAEIGVLILLMGLVYMTAFIVGSRRYR